MSNEHESSLRELTETHERLCAYVLGEGTSAERADMERELMRSPELRAQHDEIARTIGLVKEAITSGETMSPQATQFVVSAANSSKKSAWQAVPWMRLAAGLGAVALSVAIVQRAAQRNTAVESELARGFADADKSRMASGDSGEIRTGAVAATSKGETLLADSLEREADRQRGGDSTTPLMDAPAPEWGGGTNGVPLAVAAENAKVAQQVGLQHEAITRAMQPNAPTGDDRLKFGANGTSAKPEAELVQLVETLDTASSAEPFSSRRDVPAVQQQSNPPGEKLGKVSSETKAAPVVGRASGDPRSSGGGGGGVAPAPMPTAGYAGPSGPATGGPSSSGAPGARRSGDLAGLDAKYDRSGNANKPGADQHASGLDAGAVAKAEPARPGVPAAAKVPEMRGQLTIGLEGAKNKDASTSPGAPTGASEAKKRWAEVSKREALDFDGAERNEVELGDTKRRDDEQPLPYYRLSPADQQLYLDRECRRILVDCRPLPNERPRDMFFRFWGDNPFEVAALDAQSTFAADVDTASYALARRYLNEGNVPEKAQIRTEEFVNYFKSDVPAPQSGVFAIRTDLTPSRFSTDTTRQMMRVVLRGKDLSKVERKPMNLTFVVDVSGSMREQNRLEMVKHAIRLLVTQLDQYDKIAIVKFSTDAQKVLGLTPVSDRAAIESAIMPLAPEGSTNSNAGLELGYGIALGGLDANATNRVVFLSDGVANVGETDPAKIAERVKPMREKGIYLNTIGVGMNNHNDVLLEQLADKADGMCAYIDTPDEAKKQLVDNFSGAFQPIARDVKIQVEFDPTQVLRYRLLGYENRAIADADFRNEKVDAGELGAGHQVTALYEIERQSGGVVVSEKPLATVRVRWKEPRNFGTNPEQDSATEISQTVSAGDAKSFEAAGQSYRKAVMAAQFAELLRRSVHARGDSLDDLLNEALKLQKEIPNDAEFNEFVLLVSKSKDLVLRSMPVCDELCQAIDQVREFEYRRQQLASIQREMDQATLDALRRQNDELEARLRDLVRRRLENQVR